MCRLEPDLDCGLCRLRPPRDGDQASLAHHANERELWLNLRDGFPHPYTIADADAWIRGLATGGPVTHFAIEVDGQAVGAIGFILHSDVERCAAEVGYWIGRAFRGRGIVTAALREATRHAFRRYELTRVYAVPFAHNVASHRVLEKAGYRCEGVMRRSAIKDGTVLDQRMYAITNLEIAGDAG